MRAETLLLVLPLVLACEPPESKEPEEPTFTCETACANLRELACPEAEDTPEGSTCEDVCQNSFEVGIELYEWNVEQLTTATSCETP